MAGTPHGNAQWANETLLRESGFAISTVPKQDSFVLGRYVPVIWGRPHPMHKALYEGRKYHSDKSNGYLTVKGDGHIMTVAPTRSGKGVGLVIPNLLNYGESVIVIDPKGENYAKTAGYREAYMKQNRWCFDPFHVKMKRRLHGVALLRRVKSLFDLLDTKNDADAAALYAEVARIAESMVVRKRDEKDPFFNTAAQAIIKNLILIILWKSSDECPRISELRRIAADKARIDKLIDRINAAIASEGATQKNVVAYYAMREIEGYRNNRDVMATVLMQTEFLEDDNVATALDGRASECDKVFEPEVLNEFDRKHSVYLIIPPQHLERQSRFLRLIVTLAMDAVMRRSTDFRQVDRYANVLFVLDEIAQLGRLDPVQKAVSLAAGYKMTLWMFWQDLAQLKGVYPEDYASFLSNAKIQQFFGCNDMETAKYISERCGPRTQYGYSMNEQFSSRGFHADVTSGTTTNKMAGELVRASEVLRADNSIIFHFCQGTFPFLCEKIRYYEDEPFMGRQYC